MERTVDCFLPINWCDPMDEWTVYRMSGRALEAFANRENSDRERVKSQERIRRGTKPRKERAPRSIRQDEEEC